MCRVFICVLIAGGLLASTTAAAQDRLPLSVEARVGTTIPLADFADLDEQARAGLAYGVSAYVRIVPRVALYAGYSEHAFDCQRCGEGGSLRGSGVDIGARVEPPAVLGLATWFRGGAVLHEMVIDRSSILDALIDANAVRSERATGLELGGGLAASLVPGLTLTPGVRWVVYPADFTEITPAQRRDVNYLLFDLGARFAF